MHLHLIYVLLACLGFLALGSVVLPYSGTAADAKDSLLGSFGAYVDADMSLTALSGGGAITQTHGRLVITDAGVGAYTLAAPVAGNPANGGNDGQRLTIIDGSGHAHTVTTPSNKINGNKHIVTGAGAIGDEFTLTAYNGVWLVNPTITAFVLS